MTHSVLLQFKHSPRTLEQVVWGWAYGLVKRKGVYMLLYCTATPGPSVPRCNFFTTTWTMKLEFIVMTWLLCL